MSVSLKSDFFTQETSQVAVELLGQTLVRNLEKNQFLKGKIVETEAYLGFKDSSCHSFSGKITRRTEVMYRQGGCSYVYFTYGMYHCFNIITAKKGQPEAVLIRALEPLAGMEIMQKNRKTTDVENLTNGPGKLCQALQITRDLNAFPLNAEHLNAQHLNGENHQLYLERGKNIPQSQIAVSHRIGLSPLKDSCYWPLRFYIKNNLFVSRR